MMFPWKSRAEQESKICCFHFGRCGSTLLGNMARNHPAVEWHGELFHELHEGTDKSDPWRHLTGPLSIAKKSVFGFESKFQHLDSNGLNLTFRQYVDHLEELGFSKFVVLKRSNYLRQAISVARGQQTGKWHYRDSDPAPKRFAVQLDVTKLGLGGRHRELLECFQFLDETYQQLAHILSNRDNLEMSYEKELLIDPLVGFRNLLGHLNLVFSKPQIDLQRISRLPIEQTLSNFEQVASILGETQYAWMLDD